MPLSKERRIFVVAITMTFALTAIIVKVLFSDAPIVIGSTASASVIDQEATKLVIFGTPLSTADIIVILNVLGVMAGLSYVVSLSIIGKR